MISIVKGQFRQGDVLLNPVKEVKATEEVPRENGKIVLAHGEVTGHSHAIAGMEAAFLAEGAKRFLKTDEKVTLRHEEHGPIEIGKNTTFEIVIQREFDGSFSQAVAD